jgi:hypothetical protein
MITAFALIKVSPLYAAEASTFCLDTKSSKKIKTKKSFRAQGLRMAPVFRRAGTRCSIVHLNLITRRRAGHKC